MSVLLRPSLAKVLTETAACRRAVCIGTLLPRYFDRVSQRRTGALQLPGSWRSLLPHLGLARAHLSDLSLTRYAEPYEPVPIFLTSVYRSIAR